MSDSLITETVKDAVEIVKDHADDVHVHDVHAGDDHSGDHGGHHTSLGLSNTKLAMWLFLGSECLLFGGLISTYMLYRNRHSENLGPDQLWDIPFTSATSFVLLTSSLTMVLAVSAANRKDLRNAKIYLSVTALLGGLFLAGQIYEFTVFYREGLGFTTSLFSSPSMPRPMYSNMAKKPFAQKPRAPQKRTRPQ